MNIEAAGVRRPYFPTYKVCKPGWLRSVKARLLPDFVREPPPQRADDDRSEETDGSEQDDRDREREERMRQRDIRQARRNDVFDEAEDPVAERLGAHVRGAARARLCRMRRQCDR